MNITYLIGNGFDIKLGLRNRYIDFYKSYVATPSMSDPQVVKTFKAEINNFIKKELNKEDTAIDWRDLEVALGKYTTKVPLEEFDPNRKNGKIHSVPFRYRESPAYADTRKTVPRRERFPDWSGSKRKTADRRDENAQAEMPERNTSCREPADISGIRPQRNSLLHADF